MSSWVGWVESSKPNIIILYQSVCEFDYFIIAPIFFAQSKFWKMMKAGIRPRFYIFYITLFNRVVMNVINMLSVISFILNLMFPNMNFLFFKNIFMDLCWVSRRNAQPNLQGFYISSTFC